MQLNEYDPRQDSEKENSQSRNDSVFWVVPQQKREIKSPIVLNQINLSDKENQNNNQLHERLSNQSIKEFSVQKQPSFEIKIKQTILIADENIPEKQMEIEKKSSLIQSSQINLSPEKQGQFSKQQVKSNQKANSLVLRDEIKATESSIELHETKGSVKIQKINKMKANTASQSGMTSIGQSQQALIKDDPNFSHLPSQHYSKKYIMVCAIVQFIGNSLFNLDNGIVPSSSDVIKKQRNLNNTQFSALATGMFGGQILGACVSGVILQKFHPKIVMVVFVVFNLISLIVLVNTNNYPLMVFCRFLTGVSQVPWTIIYPCWAEIFGNDQQKTTWVSGLLVGAPIGNVVGYGIAALTQNTVGWEIAIYIEVALIASMALTFTVFCPMDYFDLLKANKLIKEHKNSKWSIKIDQKDIEKEPTTEKKLLNEDEKVKKINQAINSVDIQQEKQQKISQAPEGQVEEIFSSSEEKKKEESEEQTITPDEVPLHLKFLKIMKNKYFMLMQISVTINYFLITGITFWITDYLQTDLKFDSSQVFIAYTIVSVTGPIFGVTFGGWLTNRFGGYTTQASLRTTYVYMVLTFLSSAPIPFIKNFYAIIILFWCLCFFSGAVQPAMYGIILNTVGQDEITTANSFANMCYNIFGYFPAPLVYGAIYDSGQGGHGQAAMAVLLYSPIISIITLFLGGYLISRDKILERKLIMDRLVEALKKKFVISASFKSSARASLKYK